ncbi:hypothetical protein Sjap_013218 [Stephania japonica]|uniref:Uncharacterized protein n=1 Tax=Stephania japonica TaxID=461633 RepID=A0AAP0IZZ3_9MAGN
MLTLLLVPPSPFTSLLLLVGALVTSRLLSTPLLELSFPPLMSLCSYLLQRYLSHAGATTHQHPFPYRSITGDVDASKDVRGSHNKDGA